MSTHESTAIVKLIAETSQATKALEDMRKKNLKAQDDIARATAKNDTERLKRARAEEARTRQAMERMVARTKTIERAIENLSDATPKELRTVIKDIDKALNSGNVKRGSDEWKRLTEQMRAAKEQLQEIRNETRAMRSNPPVPTESDGNALTRFGKKWFGITTVVNQVADAIGAAAAKVGEFVNEYAELSEHMSSVTKYTGMTEEAVKELNKEFDKFGTSTSRAVLNDLAADAGRLGLTAKEDILEFVEAANMLNVAIGEDLGEGAVRDIGKLAELFGDSSEMGLKQAMLATGSAINTLAQSSSANEGYIMEFTARLAGMAKQAGMSQAEVMGLAAVLDQAMVNAEEGSTALSMIIQKLYRDPAKMAQAVGLDVEEFTRLIKTDANAALVQFATAAERLGGMEKLAPVLADLKITGAGVSKTLSALANNLTKVKDTQELATQSFADASSVVNEYNVANNTVKANLQKAQNALSDVRAELGERLLPVYTAFIEGTTTAGQVVLGAINWIGKYSGTIVTLAVSIGVWTVAAKANAIATAASTLATKAATVATRLWNMALRANPIMLIASAIAVAVAAIWEYTSATNEAAEAEGQREKKLNAVERAQEKATEATAKEIAEIEQLTAIVNNNSESYDNKRKAIERLNTLVPGLNKNTKKSIELTKEEIGLINQHITALRNKALAEAYHEEFVENQKRILKARRELLEAEKAYDSTVKEHPAEGDEEWAKTRERVGAASRDLVVAQGKLNEALKEQASIESALASDKDVKSYYDSLLLNPNAGGGGGGGKTKTETEAEKQLKEARKRIEDEHRAMAAEVELALAQGLTSATMASHALLQIEANKYDQLRRLKGQSDADKRVATANYYKAEQKLREHSAAYSLEQIEVEEQAEADMIRKQRADGLLTEKDYEKKLTDVRLKGLLRRKEYTAKYGTAEQRREAERAYDEAVQADKLARLQEFEQKVQAFQSEFLKKSKDEQKAAELAFLEELKAKKLVSEEEYQKALKAIEDKYEEKAKEEGGRGGRLDSMSQSVVSLAKALSVLKKQLKDGEVSWQTWANVGTASMGVILAGLQSVETYHQASQQEAIAATNREYDAQIKRVGANSKKGKQLEENKQKELAKIRTKYAKRQANMQTFQAIASSAMAAIDAYRSVVGIPLVGPAMAPIAAAAALAFGAVQVAAIKKQAAAQEQGYYRGGFTGGDHYRRPAGVVHEGEFVANHEAVNNPALAPVFAMLDTAQRRGSVASLTEADVSRAVIAPALTAVQTSRTASATAAAAPAIEVLTPATEETARAITRLNDRLDAGIDAFVEMDGDRGVARQLNKWRRLKGKAPL